MQYKYKKTKETFQFQEKRTINILTTAKEKIEKNNKKQRSHRVKIGINMLFSTTTSLSTYTYLHIENTVGINNNKENNNRAMRNEIKNTN